MADAGARLAVFDLVMPQKPVPEELLDLSDQTDSPYHDESFLQSISRLADLDTEIIFGASFNEDGTRVVRGSSEMISFLNSQNQLDSSFGLAHMPRDSDEKIRRYHSNVGNFPTLAALSARKLSLNVNEGYIN